MSIFHKTYDKSIECRSCRNMSAAESKPIQLSFCIPRFANPTGNWVSSEFTSCRHMKAVSDCRKKVDSATQQKTKHEVHTCFPQRLVTFLSANRPICRELTLPLTRENRVSSEKNCDCHAKKEFWRWDLDDMSKASGTAEREKKVAGSV